MIEVDDELAYYIHGILTSDSDSESDGKTEFDEQYNLLKPPPYDYDLIKSKIVIVSSQYTSEGWQEQLRTTENDKYIKITKDITTNAVQKLNAVRNSQKKRKTKKSKAGRTEIDLNGQFLCAPSETGLHQMNSNKRSKKKNKRKEPTAKVHGKRTIELSQKTYAGIGIKTREQFLKEFPSLNEKYSDKFRKKKIRTQSITSDVTISAKKKKHFKPLEININITSYKTQYNVPQAISETMNTSKTKIKRILKQSMQVSVSKNLLDKVSDVDHIILMGQGKKLTKTCIPVYIYGYDY